MAQMASDRASNVFNVALCTHQSQSNAVSRLSPSNSNRAMDGPDEGSQHSSASSSSSSADSDADANVASAASAGPRSPNNSTSVSTGLPNRDGTGGSNSNHNTDSSSSRSRGDDRMKRACEARIADPSLTLLGALKIGGFVFPQDQPTREDCDVDGVRLRQRKNQLSVS